MFCSKCNKLYHACSCAMKNPYQPPPPLNLNQRGTTIETVDSFGVIRAPGKPYDQLKADPFGNIPGTTLQIGPGGIIVQRTLTPK